MKGSKILVVATRNRETRPLPCASHSMDRYIHRHDDLIEVADTLRTKIRFGPLTLRRAVTVDSTIDQAVHEIQLSEE